MPWKEINGEKRYIPSIYDKDCLPTWDELYNEFYKKQIFDFDPNNKTHISIQDPYWKRPHRKMILAFACNQLNKMVYEDGIDVAGFLRNKHKYQFDKVHFILMTSSLINEKGIIISDDIYKLIEWKDVPGIYSCKIPSTNLPSIFQSNYPHIDIDELNNSMRLVIVASNDVGISISSTKELLEVINFVLKDVINYFENGIGWKDENGNTIPPLEPSKKCEGAGFDPAL